MKTMSLNKDGGNEVGLGAASSTVSSSPVLEARREKAGHECEARARVDGKEKKGTSFLARPVIPNRGGATGDEAGLV